MPRVLRRVRDLVDAGDSLPEALAAGLPGSDLATLLLAVARARAARLTPADVLRQYAGDRFTAPAAVPYRRLRHAEDALLSALPATYDVVTLAPLAPLGTHSVVAGLDQNRVVSTVRGSEVGADATTGLALEVAVRRRAALAVEPRSTAEVRLAAVQRVVRGQVFGDPGAPAHFALLGLVSGGRDTGNQEFERRHVTEHVRSAAVALRAAGLGPFELRLTVLDGRGRAAADAAREALNAAADMTVVEDPHRAAGGYYSALCYKLFATVGGQPYEVGDGGLVDWTQRLLGNRKERLMISGIGVDRVAAAMATD
jgi:hypothetical protein